MEKKWGVIAAVCIIVLAVAVAASLAGALSGVAVAATVSGEAQGFLGPVTARVGLDSSGKIVALEIEGDQGGVPDIGGPAIVKLKEEILKKGSVEGVDTVTGATITSNGVLSAIRSALSGN